MEAEMDRMVAIDLNNANEKRDMQWMREKMVSRNQ
jgi:hypothetical protein